MGKIKSSIEDWLDEYGHNLGYDMTNVPDMSDFWWIVEDNVDAEEYWEGKWKGGK